MGKTFQIQVGKPSARASLNEALLDLVTKGFVEPDGVYSTAIDEGSLKAPLECVGFAASSKPQPL